MWRTCILAGLLACGGGDKEPAGKASDSKARKSEADLGPDLDDPPRQAPLVLPKVASRDLLASKPFDMLGIVTLDANGALSAAGSEPDWRTKQIFDVRSKLDELEPPDDGDEEDDGDDASGSGTAMALEEGHFATKKPTPDPPRAEGQYKMKQIAPMAPPRKRSDHHLAKGRVRVTPVGKVLHRPLVIAHPDAPGRVLAQVLGAARGGALAVAVDGKPDVLGVGFFAEGPRGRDRRADVEVLVEKSAVKVLALDKAGAAVLWDKPFDAKGLVEALAGRTDIAVLVGEGVSAQQVVDLAVALRDTSFQLGAMTGTLAEREAADRAKEVTEPGKVVDALDPEQVNRIVVANRAKIRDCYKTALAAKPTLEGTVKTRFTIDAAGRVTSATASGVDPEVERCIAAVLGSLVFPARKDGGVANINYPFVFSRGM